MIDFGEAFEQVVGRQRLLTALPKARELLREDPISFEKMSAVAKAMAPHVREDNLDALLIRPGEMGGWTADVTLKQVPAGVANCFGTPVRMPFATREEAEESGVMLLAFALANEAKQRENPQPESRVFEYYNVVVELPEDVLLMIDSVVGARPELGYGTYEHAMERLEQITAELFPGAAVDLEKVQSLDGGPKAKLLTVMSMAAQQGVFRYPPIRPMPVRKGEG